MKNLKIFYRLLTALTFMHLLFSVSIEQANAQDTLAVEPNILGKLNDAVNGDILADGTHANPNRVYKLARGGYYPLSGTIKNVGWHLRIVGEKGTVEVPPPVIGVVVVGNAPPARMFDSEGDITFKNLYINGITQDDLQSTQIIRQRRDHSTILIENCILEFQSSESIMITTDSVSATVRNNLIRNTGGLDTNPQRGHFLRYNNATGGIAIAENNTMHNCRGLFFPAGTSALDTLIMNHNTILNCSREPQKFQYIRKYIQMTNNMYVNVGIRGAYQAIQDIDDPDGLPFGIINLYPLAVGEEERRVYVANNNYFLEQELLEYFTTVDTISAEPWMNQRTIDMFAGNDKYVEENNTFVDPIFTNPPGGLTEFIELYKQWFGIIPTTTPSPNTAWYANLRFDPDWPITVDFSYATSLIGTDGEPVGDLDWYTAGGKHLDPAEFPVNPSSVNKNNADVPTEYALDQNYPNPFNPSTTITFKLLDSGKITLNIFNILGHKVRTLVDEKKVSGQYTVIWNGKDDHGQKLSSGVYFYRLATENKLLATRKMLMLK